MRRLKSLTSDLLTIFGESYPIDVANCCVAYNEQETYLGLRLSLNPSKSINFKNVSNRGFPFSERTL